jgi:hypothetical protein
MLWRGTWMDYSGGSPGFWPAGQKLLGSRLQARAVYAIKKARVAGSFYGGEGGSHANTKSLIFQAFY